MDAPRDNEIESETADAAYSPSPTHPVPTTARAANGRADEENSVVDVQNSVVPIESVSEQTFSGSALHAANTAHGQTPISSAQHAADTAHGPTTTGSAPPPTKATTIAPASSCTHLLADDSHFVPISLPTPRQRAQRRQAEDRAASAMQEVASGEIQANSHSIPFELQLNFIRKTQEAKYLRATSQQKPQPLGQKFYGTSEKGKLKKFADELRQQEKLHSAIEAAAEDRFHLIREGELQDASSTEHERQLQARRSRLQARELAMKARQRELMTAEEREREEEEEEERQDIEMRARLLEERDQRMAAMNEHARRFLHRIEENGRDMSKVRASISAELSNHRRQERIQQERQAARARALRASDNDFELVSRVPVAQPPQPLQSDGRQQQPRPLSANSPSSRPIAQPSSRVARQVSNEVYNHAVNDENRVRRQLQVRQGAVSRLPAETQQRAPSGALLNASSSSSTEGRDASNDVPREISHTEDHELLMGSWAPRSLLQYERLRFLQGRPIQPSLPNTARLQEWVDHMLLNSFWRPRNQRQADRLHFLQRQAQDEEDWDAEG